MIYAVVQKILVISDTHCHSIKQLPQKIIEEIENAEIIVHLGDYISLNLVNELKAKKLFYGVHGNMDSYDVKAILPSNLIVNIEGYQIGLIHPPEGGPSFGIAKNLVRRFERKVDAIIYGHTHKAEISKLGDVLLINPGTATGRFPSRSKTYITINVSKELCPKIFKI